MRYLRKYKEFREFKKTNEGVGGSYRNTTSTGESPGGVEEIRATGAQIKNTAIQKAKELGTAKTVAAQQITSIKTGAAEVASSKVDAITNLDDNLIQNVTSSKIAVAKSSVAAANIDFTGLGATALLIAGGLALLNKPGSIFTKNETEPPVDFKRAIAFGSTSETECFMNIPGFVNAGLPGVTLFGNSDNEMLKGGRESLKAELKRLLDAKKITQEDYDKRIKEGMPTDSAGPNQNVRFWKISMKELKKAIENGDKTKILAGFRPLPPVIDGETNPEYEKIDEKTRTVKSKKYTRVLIGDYLKIGDQAEMKHTENGKTLRFSMSKKYDSDIIIASGNGLLALKRMMEGAIDNAQGISKAKGTTVPDIGVIKQDAQKRESNSIVFGFTPGMMMSALSECYQAFQFASMGSEEQFIKNWLASGNNTWGKTTGDNWIKLENGLIKSAGIQYSDAKKQFQIAFQNSSANVADLKDLKNKKLTEQSAKELLRMTEVELVDHVQKLFMGLCSKFIPVEMYEKVGFETYYKEISTQLDFQAPSADAIKKGLSAFDKGYCLVSSTTTPTGNINEWRAFCQEVFSAFIHNFQKYALTILPEQEVKTLASQLSTKLNNNTISDRITTLSKVFNKAEYKLDGPESGAKQTINKTAEEDIEGN